MLSIILNSAAVYLFATFPGRVKGALITDCTPGTYYENGNCISGSANYGSNIYNAGSYTSVPYNSYVSPYYGNTNYNSYISPYYTGNSNYYNYPYGYSVCTNGNCYSGNNNGNTLNTVCNNGVCYTNSNGYTCSAGVCTSNSNSNTNSLVCTNGVCYSSASATSGYSCINGVCTYSTG